VLLEETGAANFKVTSAADLAAAAALIAAAESR
jgi:2-C-methyl-D-erythritol 4-phosphate cytidylyltransferase